MSTKENVTKLQKQADDLYRLIQDTNRVLDTPMPASCVQLQYERELSEVAPKLVVTAQKMMNRGKIEELLLGATVLAGGYAVAKTVDVVRNSMARRNARKLLLSYYQELVSKQGLIVAEQQKIHQLMAEYLEKLQDNEEYYREHIKTLQQRQQELTDLLMRMDQLSKQM